MPQIVVINNRPGVFHLPWILGKQAGILTLNPGRNDVDAEVFEAVAKQAGEKAWRAHYSKFLMPLSEAADESGTIDPNGLNAEEFIALIKGTIDLDALKEYQAFEQKGGNRKTILKAIAAQVEEIENIDTAKKEKK